MQSDSLLSDSLSYLAAIPCSHIVVPMRNFHYLSLLRKVARAAYLVWREPCEIEVSLDLGTFQDFSFFITGFQ